MNPIRPMGIAAITLIAIAFSNPCSAQVNRFNPEGKPGLSIDFTAASFRGDGGSFYKFPTSATFITGQIRIAHSVQIVCELPIAYLKFEPSLGPASEWYPSITKLCIANPYVGFEFGRIGSSAVGSFGVRLPVISEENANDVSDVQYIAPQRFLAFVPKAILFSALGGYRQVDPSGFGWRFAGGGQLALPTKGGDPEVYGELATNFWVSPSNVRVMSTFGGLVWLTEDNVDFGDRLLLNLTISVDIALGQWRPGAHFTIPIDQTVRNRVSSMYGVQVSYFFSDPQN
jgi:hypothetical protein